MNDLTVSEHYKTPPPAATRYIEWFTGDAIFLGIMLFVNIVLVILMLKTRANIGTLYTAQVNKLKAIVRPEPSKEMKDLSVDDIQEPVNTEPVQYGDGLMND